MPQFELSDDELKRISEKMLDRMSSMSVMESIGKRVDDAAEHLFDKRNWPEMRLAMAISTEIEKFSKSPSGRSLLRELMCEEIQKQVTTYMTANVKEIAMQSAQSFIHNMITDYVVD